MRGPGFYDERYEGEDPDEDRGAIIGEPSQLVFLRLEWPDLDLAAQAIFASEQSEALALTAADVRLRISYLSQLGKDTTEERRALAAFERAFPG